MSNAAFPQRSLRIPRRTLLRAAGAMTAAGSAATLLGGLPAAAATTTGTAPVPPAAKGPAIPAKGYLVEELGDDLYWLTDGMYQMMFLVSDEGVIAVDAPPTLGNNILRAIREVTPRPVTDVVYSHHHADHIGAAVLYPSTARRYAHVDAAEILSRVKDPNRPAPTHTFATSREVRRGNQRLELSYQGPNHSPGNLFVYAPRQKTLMLVDVIFPGWVPFAYLAVSSDIPGWVTAHERALEYPFQKLIGGHLTRLGTRDDVVVQQEYIADVRATTEAAYADVDFGAILDSVDQENGWAIFNAYLDAVVTRASEDLVPRWVDRLGGADVFTKSSVFTMAEAIRLDYGSLGPFGIRP
ncbi:MBL fold metallo-hydrolase [Micromonospora avicenniae]|uniref:Glyoxylase, beta-lactamase superfamily II n=1 Tax=Micromonospora avicenniae TaxID=1198245 RepID=A0A1N7F117_9ACTN|nr:MBL fold metallo-hydrolase [Micromonospora avicenniae]SIR94073.1 Glyoxylase, beta-lactamase superfamily II [Micromonospora avicenniae]